MAKGLTYRKKTASGERIALYPPKLHTLVEFEKYDEILQAKEKWEED